MPNRWLITEYHHSWVDTTLMVATTSDVPCHLWLRWTDKQERMHLRTTRRRGLDYLADPYYCFTEYQDIEQNEAGDTIYHTFDFPGWFVCCRRWWYLYGTIDGLATPSMSPIFTAHYLDYEEDESMRHIDLTHKEVAGVIDHADRSVGPAKLEDPLTFDSFPLTPATAPTQDYEVANKKYVDDAALAPGDYPKKLKPALPRWTIPGWYYTGRTNQKHYDNRLYTTPIFVSESTTYIAIGVHIGSTVSPGDLARLGVYRWADGIPGLLLFDAGTIEIWPSGFKQIAITQNLPRGYYFTAIVFSVDVYAWGISHSYAHVPPVPGITDINVPARQYCVLQAGVAASVIPNGLPDPAPAPTNLETSNFASVILREN